MEYLVTRHLHKAYNRHVALSDINIAIPKQSIFGLLGPNGAGKTSLIRIIAQIIRQDQGDVLINGESLTRKHMSLTGYLPEERGLYRKMEVADMLMYFSQLKGVEERTAKARIKTWLEKFDLLAWADSKVDKLSKGMQQKLQFIATVIHNPALIILDEPFSGFDPVNAELVVREMKQLRDEGCTIIMSTHRMDSVESLCDHVAMINKSHKVLDGTIAEVRNAFRKNTFEVEYRGDFKRADIFTIVSQQRLDEDYSRVVLTLNENLRSGELIQNLAHDVDIHLFREVLPTMHDIFLEKVAV